MEHMGEDTTCAKNLVDGIHVDVWSHALFITQRMIENDEGFRVRCHPLEDRGRTGQCWLTRVLIQNPDRRDSRFDR